MECCREQCKASNPEVMMPERKHYGNYVMNRVCEVQQKIEKQLRS